MKSALSLLRTLQDSKENQQQELNVAKGLLEKLTLDEPYKPMPVEQMPERTDDPLSLSNSKYGLSEIISKAYETMGITQMYEWQAECLSLKGILADNKNLVYSAPTSAGKTFVAEIITLKKIVENRKKAMIILPFVSVVTEKVGYLKRLLSKTRLRIVGHFGNSGHATSFDKTDIAVCTIEKANSLINRLIFDKALDKLGVVVIDELHLIGDEHRGYLLELLLTKLLYRCRGKIQIIGLSATLPNIDLVARWLDATLYITHFRPVPLTEYILIKNEVFDASLKHVRKISVQPHPMDPDLIVPLVFEVVQENKSVLIFCPSKDSCEKTAQSISRLMNFQLDGSIVEKRLEVLTALTKATGVLDVILEETVQRGIAYHHAGLTTDEREIIENAFRSGVIQVLVATSTLASGVNLPAKRVILKYPYVGRQFMDSKSYKQMSGRAGRKGQDTIGESFLVCKPQDKSKVTTLIQQSLESVHSCLTLELRGMKRALLESIVGELVKTDADIFTYSRNTMLAAEIGDENTFAVAHDALQFLIREDMIMKNADGTYVASKLGMAIVASSLSPEEGTLIFKELQKSMRKFVLDNDLYLIYHLTPIFVSVEVPWGHFLDLFLGLEDDTQHVAKSLGINEGFLSGMANGSIPWKSEKYRPLILLHQRFYGAMALNELILEIPLGKVVETFRINRGTLQMLQLSASAFTGMISKFCERLGWLNLQLLVDQFADRLNFGVKKELLNLCQIANMKSYQARHFYESGIRSLPDLARSNAADLAKILTFPFKGASLEKATYDFELKQCKTFIESAKSLLREEQIAIVRSARELKQVLDSI